MQWSKIQKSRCPLLQTSYATKFSTSHSARSNAVALPIPPLAPNGNGVGQTAGPQSGPLRLKVSGPALPTPSSSHLPDRATPSAHGRAPRHRPPDPREPSNRQGQISQPAQVEHESPRLAETGRFRPIESDDAMRQCPGPRLVGGVGGHDAIAAAHGRHGKRVSDVEGAGMQWGLPFRKGAPDEITLLERRDRHPCRAWSSSVPNSSLRAAYSASASSVSRTRSCRSCRSKSATAAR